MATIELIGHLPGVVHAFSFIYGGSHAGNRLAMQFMILPVGASSYEETMKIGMKVYQQLMAVIKDKYGQDPTNVGDEGGSAPIIQEEEGLELLKMAIDKAGYTHQVVIAPAVAASEFYGSDKIYDLNFKDENTIPGYAPKVLYKPFVFKYPNVSIEDPFDHTLPHKILNHGGTGRITCTGESCAMEVDSYNVHAQESKLQHNEEVDWMDVDSYNDQVSKVQHNEEVDWLDVDSYNDQVSKVQHSEEVNWLQHNEEVDWKDVERVWESFARSFDETKYPREARFEAMREVIRIACSCQDDIP